MTINEIQDEIIGDFELFDDWEEKYIYIIELGKKLSPLSEEFKIDKYKIKGCQSNVWLTTALKDGRIHYKADSDAIIVKGLVSLLIKVLDQQSPEDIAKAELYFIERIGMKQHLSMTRANGLSAMIKQMKYYAIALQES